MNPANAHALDAKILAVRGGQIWLHAGDGAIEVIRGWMPAGLEGKLTLDSDAIVYLDEEHSINGWWACADGLGVNQRLCKTGPSKDARSLACQGDCGRPWICPAPDELLQATEHCLTCNGELADTA